MTTMRTERREKELDWHLGDIEQRCGFSGGKFTDVNLWFAFLATALITGAFFIGLCHVPPNIRSHPAIAITDHGSLQAFPAAFSACAMRKGPTPSIVI